MEVLEEVCENCFGPSHESRNGSTSNQKNARTTLPAAEDAQQRDAPRPWIPALQSMCLLVQSAVLRSNCMRAALPSRRRCCHQIAQQLGSFAAHIFHKSHRPTVSRPCHIASFSPLPQLLLPPLVSTHFRCNVLRSDADVYPVVAGRIGNQLTTSMAQLTLGAAVVVTHPAGCAPRPRSLLPFISLRSIGPHDAVKSWLPLYWQVERVLSQRLLTHVPIIAFPQSTHGARACIWCRAESQRRCHPPLRILC